MTSEVWPPCLSPLRLFPRQNRLHHCSLLELRNRFFVICDLSDELNILDYEIPKTEQENENLCKGVCSPTL
jgi:hypothetical protein